MFTAVLSDAANRALERAGVGWGDIVVAELNEAFASQTLACMKGWPDLDPDKLNVNGGAIAIGHPLGASGARILATLAHELRRLGQVATGRGARRRLNKIIAEAAAARRPELRRLAATLTEWRDPICARFDNGRVTNAATEAINTLIKKIKRIGHGYRNFANYRLRLLITWGKITMDKTVTPIGLRPHTTLP